MKGLIVLGLCCCGFGIYEANPDLVLVACMCFVGAVIIHEQERHVKAALITILLVQDKESELLIDDVIQIK